MLSLKQGDLLFWSCIGTYSNHMYQLVRYNPANESCNTVATLPLKEVVIYDENDFFGSSLFFEKDGKIFTSLGCHAFNKKLITYDMNTNDWEELYDYDDTYDRTWEFMNENKYYVIFDYILPNVSPEQGWVFDIGTRQLKVVKFIDCEAPQWPSGSYSFVATKFEDCAYFFAVFNKKQLRLLKDKDNKIYRLHLPSLTWSVLPNDLPNSKLLFVPVVTKDGQLHLFYEDGLLQINLSNQTRLLQRICWDFIVNHPRSRPLAEYTDEELFNRGIQKKFISKLRW